MVPVIEQRLRIKNDRDTKWNVLTSPEESFYGKLCTLPLGLCVCVACVWAAVPWFCVCVRLPSHEGRCRFWKFVLRMGS